MCGRYTLTKLPPDWSDLLEMPALLPPSPRYNIAPGQYVLTILHDPEYPHPLAQLLYWGLLPAWVKDPKARARPINARAETAAEKPYFRAALRHRRCLIPADGFYEWTGTGSARHPRHFRMQDRRPFAFAGIWERWEGANGELIDSCAILTTTPNTLIRQYHHRMPVILEPAQFAPWLSPGDQSARTVAALLKPYPPEGMESVEVCRRVNSVAHDDPACLLPP